MFVEGQPYFRSVSDGVYVDPLAALGLPRFNVEKRITKEICVWKPGMVDWQLAEFVPEALCLVALASSLVPRGGNDLSVVSIVNSLQMNKRW